MSVAVILPTYNERENLEPIIEELLSLDRVTHIIIVDDNSPDGTGRLADKLAARDGRVAALHRPAKAGLGGAYVAGFEAALQLGAEIMLTMDADFSHHPRYIPEMLGMMDLGYDIVIGSRYIAEGGTRNWGARRRLLSAGANATARRLLGLQAHDCTAGFRAYRSQVIDSVPLHHIRSNGYSFLVEMLYHCQRMGYSIGEVPIVFEDRLRGSSKINQQEIFKAIFTVIRLGFNRLGLRLGKGQAIS